MKRKLLAVALCAMATIRAARADGTNTATGTAKPPAPVPGTNSPAEAAKPPGPAPKLKFDKTVYDFGTTSFVDSVTGTFTFQNAGEAELKIGKPQPACGCTVASVKPDVLKPGDKGELVFKVNIGAAHGAMEKRITVPSNDPQAPNVNLTIKADVRQVVQVSPAQIMVGALRQGMITNVTAVVRRTDGQKLVVSNAQPSSKEVRAHVEPIEGSSNQAARLIFDVEAEGRPRQINDNVKIFLEGVTQPVASVSIVGQLLGDVTVAPEQLFWPITDPSRLAQPMTEAQKTRRVSVSSTRPDQPLEIKNLATSLKDLSVELVTIETGKTYSVVAKFADPPKESERGTITFDTNTSIQPKIMIPVTITVLK